MPVDPIFESCKKTSIEDSEVVLVFERNNAGLKKLLFFLLLFFN
jgi:hypothetical protein